MEVIDELTDLEVGAYILVYMRPSEKDRNSGTECDYVGIGRIIENHFSDIPRYKEDLAFLASVNNFSREPSTWEIEKHDITYRLSDSEYSLIVLTETIYNWPGLGRWAVRAILNSDMAAINGFTLLVAFVFVTANLIVDLVYGTLDPRIRFG